MAQVVSKVFVFPSTSNCGHNSNIHHAFVKKSVNLSSLKLKSPFVGGRLAINGTVPKRITHLAASGAQMGIGIRNTPKWWEKGLQPNMKEVNGAQDLVDSLSSAGDKLVVVDFFSPGCGGCRALHPKICQLAEMNPDVQFLQVNYEEHKSMCYSLNVHVLPFFRFYRGAEGRVCSFSCTNATIKKFKDALAKYGADRCTFGPPKGLEEKELVALAANKDLSFTYSPKTEEPVPLASKEEVMERTPRSPHIADSPLPLPLPLPIASTTSPKAKQGSASEAFAISGR